MPGPSLQWDLFCRVIDNHGDLGVCWRLARRLAALGQRVRLWVDDASALAWMAPQGAAGVETMPWRDPTAPERPGDVVVEAFGCDPPAGFVEAMAAADPAPVWINLEYLSAERAAERNHGLPSPQLHGPGAGLCKWFFYPGFSPATGGLLREEGLASDRDRFEPVAWLAGLGIDALPHARRISLFCYEQAALAATLARWRQASTQLLVTPGFAARQVAGVLGVGGAPGTVARQDALRVHFLPWLTQDDYDRLLWSCDLNLVRGEDSLVRALWAARPFVWQLYPQCDGAHGPKLEAFLDDHLAGAPTDLALSLGAVFRHWNGLAAPPAAEPAPGPWQAWSREREARLATALSARGDLGSQLYRYALSKR
ncbi:elongation factor P maturation arginine rhamnosyltransferase EarP [uncultured Methylibium sp.]|uniref:elongation factor P maturation arginine rhamnosyltransferase EarP n=1 Tax=uncultured Methylibium sp. TaxID=381093 RepID=UPI0025EBF490|nr:elongation factor P maturation arginine rhamnosyltransferase EarP [uncultured Methylibium sp.]